MIIAKEKILDICEKLSEYKEIELSVYANLDFNERFSGLFNDNLKDYVTTWFCYTPEIIIIADDEHNNQELHNSIKK